ncbi:MAG: UxaA family hydrolase [Chthoniobacterales bacterium]
MANSDLSPSLIQIHADDNVAVLAKNVSAGERFQFQNREFQFPANLILGHKIALRDIRSGEKILKYGSPIGSAITDIRMGDHVHLHNLQSDYLPTYTLNDDHKFAR